MWESLHRDVSDLFASLQNVDQTPGHGENAGTLRAISAEARLEVNLRAYERHERLVDLQLERDARFADEASYMCDFIKGLVRRQGEARAAMRRAKMAKPALTCTHESRCAQPPEPGRRMCRRHLDMVAAAMRASRERRRAHAAK